ncbi:TIGR03086 family metal-binding protein [Solicola gregarius]|uniref:TIGR03086 family metal-binding protein n=1 Tax=Solicola gregarius TaxID=2908642 RepID=A0AA46TJJ8_9ACTN|nr:TIGR03086 family metal-binding protein [Solicola gregarius]UYM06441.1 TIGR03086 family metal-binding protein [Solicola gregarius]
MESIAQRYARLRHSFAAKVAAVPVERWQNRSPCEDWTALDVVRHVIETQRTFERLVDRELEPGPPVDDDPNGAFLAATDQVQAHLDDPETAKAGYTGYFGPTTFEESIDGFLSMDLVVHGWDLARAAGLDEHIDPADVAWVWSRAEALNDTMRGPKTYGPAIDAEPDASDQDKLLAFLGRQP